MVQLEKDALLSTYCQCRPVPFRLAVGPADTTLPDRSMRAGRRGRTGFHSCLFLRSVYHGAGERRLRSLLCHPYEAKHVAGLFGWQ